MRSTIDVAGEANGFAPPPDANEAPSAPDASDASVTPDVDASTDTSSQPGDAASTGDALDAESSTDVLSEAFSPITVKGTVMGYWRHPVPDVNVYVGDRVARTDSKGQFTFDGVRPPYDVRIAVHANARTAIWHYKALTRPDPTLQVKDAVPYHRIRALYSFPNLPAASMLEGGTVPRTLQLAFGSPAFAFHIDAYEDQPDFEYATDWEGPSPTSGTIHALLWDQTDTFGPPTKFVAYDTHALTLQVGAPNPNTALDMTADVIAAAPLTGTVSSYPPTQQVSAHLRFDDGAIMLLGQVGVSVSTFSIPAHKIPGPPV